MSRYILVFLTLFMVCTQASSRTTFEEFEAKKSAELARQASALAKWAVEQRLSGKPTNKPPMKLDKIFNLRAGVFVTINKKGKPRGCWGTIEPRQKDIVHEIIENAIGAASSDTRRKPLTPGEIEQVTFCISIMGPLKPVQSISELAPGRYGLLVRSGSKEGILLPGEAKTARWQIEECKRKAGIPPRDQVKMFIFRTVTLEDRD